MTLSLEERYALATDAAAILPSFFDPNNGIIDGQLYMYTLSPLATR